MSKLYLVGTPIGNLGDFSPRAIETLKSVDFIAAEDTRVTLKLLNRFEISKPMVSYYQHNQKESGERILARLQSGESCALVTDAGMPAISDPGEGLVKLCADAGIEVTSIPGPSAAVTALALSALPAGRFTFEGFLPVEKKERRERLNELKDERRTMIFYEAPHKLAATLADMSENFGAQRSVSLCRELTKLHEEVIRTTLGEALERFSGMEAPRGEFVLVVQGGAQSIPEATLEDAVITARRLMAEGLSASAAAKQAAQLTGCKKGDIYREL